MEPAADPNPYDEVPYLGHAYNYTHPDRLAVMGALFGLQPAPVERCRVLELGCGDGANLLPMAHTLPESRFFGIDLAAKPIAQGQRRAAQLGASNLRLEAMDILDFPADAGEFDYIITHGIYSWVPPVVREKILAICQAHLAPQGVAYVSYKVFPGSQVSGTIHDMMRFQASRRPGMTEEEIVHAGLDMVRTVVKSKPELDAYRGLLDWRLRAIDERMAAYGGYTWIYYDLGVEISDPFYFYQFMEQAGRHGLQFLSEPELGTRDPKYTPEALAALDALGDDVVAREQFEDFLLHREFRRTLLCRAEATLDRALGPERFRPLYVASPLRPLSAPTPVDEPLAKEEFSAPGGIKVMVDQTVVKSALRHLGEAWPRAVSFDELLSASEPAADDSPDRAADVERLTTILLAMFRADMINLLTRAPDIADTVSERPVTSAIMRQQLAEGRPILTNLRHVEMETKDPEVRQLLSLLDGTRDREALLHDLNVWLDARRAQHPDAHPEGWLDENIDRVLQDFVRQQFLEA